MGDDNEIYASSDTECQSMYPETPQRQRRKKSTMDDILDSPGSSRRSGSSIRSRDRHQGWGIQSLYTRLMRTFHRAWKEVRFRGRY